VIYYNNHELTVVIDFSHTLWNRLHKDVRRVTFCEKNSDFFEVASELK